ncbi:MAG: tetratricopeptide repeat protein, partial [Chloroflexi bacterium]|nr:tetratricopeptide repeat protein [Chloroflexota bacterium]
PTPTPTPAPADLWLTGQRALFYGDWDAAQAAFRAAADRAATDAERAQALTGLGRAYYATGRYPEALDILRQVVEQYGHTPAAAEAYAYLGWTYAQLQRYADAAAAFEAAAPLSGPLTPYLHEWAGDAWFNAGLYADSARAYQAALDAQPFAERVFGIYLGLARALYEDGRYDQAHQTFQTTFNLATDDGQRARTLYHWAQVYFAQENPDQGYDLYRQLVVQYPTSPYAYPALVALVEAEQPVDDLSRGLVDFFAGQYGPAIAVLDRVINTQPDHDGTPHYYKALALRAAGEPQAAIEEWDRLITQHPGDGWWDEAWEQMGYTQWAYLNDYDGAIATFVGFVETAPTHRRAADFLFFAAQVAERAGALDQAASLWIRVLREYPASPRTGRAARLAAVTLYRIGDLPAAQGVLYEALDVVAEPEDRAGLYLWLGKVAAAQGDSEAARAAWNQAALTDPTGYYSQRAHDLLQGRAPFEPPAAYDTTIAWEAERRAAADWVRQTFLAPPGEDLLALGPVAQDPRWQRGRQLWDWGFYASARQEIEALRRDLQDDALNTFRLIEPLRQMGLYRSAIFAARRVLDLAGMDDFTTLTAPVYFNHVRFGPYFADLVVPTAERYGFHPLQLYAVIRQESLFEGFIASGAGARGLMQIIPSTGQALAEQAEWPPGYTADDLYRPVVSIRFGAAYLAQQRALFDGDWYAALAAYNAGPGNAQVWYGLSGGDPDLFLEIVRYQETHLYIRRIYEIYELYRYFYARSP